MRKHTQFKAAVKAHEAGCELLGAYRTNNQKTLFKCPVCGKAFLARPKNIFQGLTKTCSLACTRRMQTA